jgi:hypothetical protein
VDAVSAWGPRPLENDLAQAYFAALAEREICPILAEPMRSEVPPGVTMQLLAYDYDRLRAAVELMLMLGEAGVPFSKGFYQLAIYKIMKCRDDSKWLDCWSGPDTIKRQNYQASVDEQLRRLGRLESLAKV